MKCQYCNHPIKREYTYEGKIMGIECFKKYALPEILRKRQEKWEEQKKQRYMRMWFDVEALKAKDLSKVKSPFKLSFIPSVIQQFEEKGFLSNRQIEIVVSMMTKKDRINRFLLQYELLDDDIDRFILLCEARQSGLVWNRKDVEKLGIEVDFQKFEEWAKKSDYYWSYVEDFKAL